ncbi:methyl-accepting chemotaxis protein [Spirochaetota bacterium]
MTLKKIQQYFLSQYDNVGTFAQKRASAFLYVLFFFITCSILLGIAINIAEIKNVTTAYITLIAFFIVICASLVLLKKGYYTISANLTTIFTAIIVSAAFMGKLNYAPADGYTTLIYFMYMVIVISALLTSWKVLLGVSIYFVICDITYLILALAKVGEALKPVIKIAAVESTFSIIAVYGVLSGIQYISKQAVETAESESKTNKDQYNKLSQIIESLKNVTSVLIESSKQLQSTAESMSISTVDQANNVDEISTSLEGIGDIASRNATSSRDNAEDATSAANLTIDGWSKFSETFESMKIITDKINIIEDISSQTDLLALNASIEAARAGEVRKLSEKTRSASKEIVELSNSSLQVSEKAGEILEEIVDRIKRTAKLMIQIKESSENQDDGIIQIRQGMVEMSKITQNNALLSESLKSTAKLLSNNALELQKLLDY